jgi:hypothetical protein
VLDKFQESDLIVDERSEIPQTGKDHRNTIKTRSTCEQEESQASKVIISTNSGNTDSHETEIKNHQPIPVIVNGLTPTSKNPPAKRQNKNAAHKKDHKMLIVGDSHARLWTQNVKSQIKNNFYV